MEFSLSEEQTAFQTKVRSLAEQHLAEGALKRAHDDGFPSDVARWMAKNGLIGMTIPREDGGQGGTLMQAVLAIETVAQVCPRSADVVQSGNFGPIRVLSAFGSPAQKKKYLTKLLAGELLITVAMSEPEAGSAVTDLETTATPDGDGFKLNGTKVFTTNGLHADLFLAYVRFGPGIDGIGSVLVERTMKGFKTGKPAHFLSGEGCVEIRFEDMYVPAENVLLGAGGFKKQISGFNVERLGNASRSLGVGRCAFNLARSHALKRQQFGRPLCEFQGIQWKFADMEMQLQAAQLLLYRAATNADKGFPSALDTAIAKTYCNMAGFNAANEALQVMGGLGYTDATLVEYCFRKTRGWQIAGGSTEMMKNRIAESVFDRTFSQRAPRAKASA
jgi:alkylation response protein AidB-like acyl-CoA dehydrogenase